MGKKDLTGKQLEMKELLKEKVEMYNFNPKVIEKIINIYGPEVKLK